MTTLIEWWDGLTILQLYCICCWAYFMIELIFAKLGDYFAPWDPLTLTIAPLLPVLLIGALLADWYFDTRKRKFDSDP